ncbi:MAG: histidinol dehydrogenase [Alphaproteobacteria bacterium]|nr:histidinol dehydrogenase [Alphaproteobacteria bacterium]
MVLKLNSRSPDFESRFMRMLGMRQEVLDEVNEVTAHIIKEVRCSGDAALISLTETFDRTRLTSAGLRVCKDEIVASYGDLAPDTLRALNLARDRIRSYHLRQMPCNERFFDPIGIELGHRWTPIEAVGLYVPGGVASYPSSVLMSALPARVAGVERLVMTVPCQSGVLNPIVLVAADLAGVDEIYKIGGAQAIAALAYGTETIQAVDKVVGPGNAYVAAAKRQLFGTVGIDMIAGPSEVLIVADEEANPEWIAIDLLAQAEHDTSARPIFVTASALLSSRVEACIESCLRTLPRTLIASRSWMEQGVIIEVERLEDAASLVNRIAPEHLQLAMKEPEYLLKEIKNAGSIFLGMHTPEAIGDYVAGPNHVLPTARGARYASGLNVLDFLKRSSLIRCTAEGLASLGPDAVCLARAEGLEGHARSVLIRLADGI